MVVIVDYYAMSKNQMVRLCVIMLSPAFILVFFAGFLIQIHIASRGMLIGNSELLLAIRLKIRKK